MSYASSYPNSRPSGAETITTSVGWYVNMNFIYDNRYFVDGSFRTSGGSNYGTITFTLLTGASGLAGMHRMKVF